MTFDRYHAPVVTNQTWLTGLGAAVLLALAGVAVAYFLYMVKPELPAAIQARVRPLHALLDNKYYLDWLNENVIARAARMLGVGLWKGGDQAVIDGAMKVFPLSAAWMAITSSARAAWCGWPAWRACSRPATSITTRSR